MTILWMPLIEGGTLIAPLLNSSANSCAIKYGNYSKVQKFYSLLPLRQAKLHQQH